MNVVTTVLAFVVTLGLLIVVHELGHYFVARLCDVKVLRFSVVSDGPLTREHGPDRTEFRSPRSARRLRKDARRARRSCRAAEAHRAFNRQKVGRRFAIVAAGPISNFLLAILLYWILFMHGVPGIKPIIGVIPDNTPAASAGFTAGETITKIGDEPIATWQDARWVFLQRAVQKARVAVTTRSPGGSEHSRELDLSGLTPADLDSDFLRVLGLSRYNPPLARSSARSRRRRRGAGRSQDRRDSASEIARAYLEDRHGDTLASAERSRSTAAAERRCNRAADPGGRKRKRQAGRQDRCGPEDGSESARGAYDRSELRSARERFQGNLQDVGHVGVQLEDARQDDRGRSFAQEPQRPDHDRGLRGAVRADGMGFVFSFLARISIILACSSCCQYPYWMVDLM